MIYHDIYIYYIYLSLCTYKFLSLGGSLPESLGKPYRTAVALLGNGFGLRRGVSPAAEALGGNETAQKKNVPFHVSFCACSSCSWWATFACMFVQPFRVAKPWRVPRTKAWIVHGHAEIKGCFFRLVVGLSIFIPFVMWCWYYYH